MTVVSAEDQRANHGEPGQTPPGAPAARERPAEADEERAARALLSQWAEPGDAGLHAAVGALGARAVARLIDGAEADPFAGLAGGPSPVRVAGYRARRSAAEPARLMEAALRAGVRWVVPGDGEWPTSVEDLRFSAEGRARAVPPLILWVHGEQDLRLMCKRSVALVGARAATGYGEHVAGELGIGLAQRGWTVVSGAAYGIDAAAHRGALAADGATVAVLACGVDVVYPRGHDRLLARIAGAGAVVAELPPGAQVTRSRLLQRNRLVAALTRGTVVVEAAVRSGTTTTARHAAALNRVVMAVPGAVTSAASVGCHELLRAGQAVLVTDAPEVIDAVGDTGRDLAPERRGERRDGDGLPVDQLRILDALPVIRAISLVGLASAAGLELGAARAALGAVLADGLAEPDGSGYRLSAAVRRRRRSQGSGVAAAGRLDRPG